MDNTVNINWGNLTGRENYILIAERASGQNGLCFINTGTSLIPRKLYYGACYMLRLFRFKICLMDPVGLVIVTSVGMPSNACESAQYCVWCMRKGFAVSIKWFQDPILGDLGR